MFADWLEHEKMCSYSVTISNCMSVCHWWHFCPFCPLLQLPAKHVSLCFKVTLYHCHLASVYCNCFLVILIILYFLKKIWLNIKLLDKKVAFDIRWSVDGWGYCNLSIVTSPNWMVICHVMINRDKSRLIMINLQILSWKITNNHQVTKNHHKIMRLDHQRSRKMFHSRMYYVVIFGD